jgi:hypothetical protein
MKDSVAIFEHLLQSAPSGYTDALTFRDKLFSPNIPYEHRAQLLFIAWKLEKPAEVAPYLIDQLFDSIQGLAQHQQHLIGHDLLIEQLPNFAEFSFLSSLLDWLFVDPHLDPNSLASLVFWVLSDIRTGSFLSSDKQHSVLKIWSQLLPCLSTLQQTPLSLSLPWQQALKDYLLTPFIGNKEILKGLMLSLSVSHPESDWLHYLCQSQPEKTFHQLLDILSSANPSPILPLLPENFECSIFLDPKKGLILDVFKAIFTYLNFSFQPLIFPRGPLLLSEMLMEFCKKQAGDPLHLFERIKTCYLSMKFSPIVYTLNNLRQNHSWSLLRHTLNISTQMTSVNAPSPLLLTEKFCSEAKTHHALVEFKPFTLLLEEPFFDRAQAYFANWENTQHLSEPLTPLCLSQMLLRLCENQTIFNKTMKNLIKSGPVTRGSFIDYLLSLTDESIRPLTSEIIDQESWKIFFDEDLCSKLLLEIEPNKQKLFCYRQVQNLTLALGPTHEYPHYLAELIHKRLVQNYGQIVDLTGILNTLILLSHRPPLLRLGKLHMHDSQQTSAQLYLGYHHILKRPEFYILNKNAMRHVDFQTLMPGYLILAKQP